ncbi:hypothetical protein GCL60_10670 [Silvanigrella paludirubra]|uniref:Beta-propeller fold lactonase family protein n=1 Tax=Silvanigrella paludirubra TaxID=2499159 RepID=A0A6N6VPX8_9BACT|nr:hypothetical protein [Silvanigrella paludirubra]KAB8037629.1 hypothetical protein GCL60_10670 [Silvanigrella paludirubra]
MMYRNFLFYLAISAILVVGCSKGGGGSGSGANSSGDVIVSNQQPDAIKVKQTTYMYLVNRNTSKVTKCLVDQNDGSISDCVDTGSKFQDPIGISVYNNFAYVVNNKSASNSGTVTVCQINKLNGVLTDCLETPVGTTFADAHGPTAKNGYLYIAHYGPGGVTKCAINSTSGTLSGCAKVADKSGSIVIKFSNKYSYTTNFNNNTINKCEVNMDDGSMSKCSLVSINFNKPNGIFISGSNAYIASAGDNKIYKCNIKSDGDFDGCGVTAYDKNQALYSMSPISINIINNNAYITSVSSNKLTICQVNNSNFESCNQVTDPLFANLDGTSSYTITSSENLLAATYITARDLNKVFLCNIDLGTSALSNCRESGSNFAKPTTAIIKDNFIFVGSGDGSGNITKCNVNKDGLLSGCVKMATDSKFNAVHDLKIYKNRLYFASYGQSKIGKCDYDSTNGNISKCVETGDNISYPAAIEFKDAKVYITMTGDNGVYPNRVSICDVDNSQQGIINKCVKSEDFQPGGKRPSMIDIITTPNNSYIYIPNEQDYVVRCAIGNNGQLVDCRDAQAGIKNPFITRYFNNKLFVLTRQNDTVYACNIDSSNGLITECNVSAKNVTGSSSNPILHGITVGLFNK